MKRRFIAVLAVAALTATLGGGISSAAAEEPPSAAYVAIGDSVASGNGLLPYYDTACLRSKKAYPTVLAGMLGGSVVSAACSGASTTAVATQAATLAAQGVLGGATELVTITAGVNDLNWLAVLAACSTSGTPEACAAAQAAAQAAVAAIPAGIAQTIGIVRASAPNAQIVVTGYPILFGTFTGTCSIGASNGAPVKFGVAEAQATNDGVAGVNLAVQFGILLYQQQFMAQFGQPDLGVEYVDVTAAFAGHGLCDTGERWISGLVSGKPVDRGFHPNVSGQQAYASAIAAALAN